MPLSKFSFDPESLPVDAIAGEAALGQERMLEDWLRQRFAAPPDWMPEPADESLATVRMVAASVLVPLVQRPEGLHLLLTRRTDHLTAHAGQISFPGGRAEPEDASAIDTALRETEEEIGLARSHIDVIGLLPDYVTSSGYRVTPVVGLVHPPFELTLDPNEVAAAFEVPLAFLMDGMNHQRLSVELPQGAGRRHFYAIPYGPHFIWGATAGMLRNLFHLLRA
ncbi:CoA pyrophosphatase [Massilia soli]|uniref:CoA pyrophosphatase n=1 Tax=Massilia soli TaxID=2792854 RepID=A0ABS7SKG9_9BURK|nr:CoA pyrophosphatase [Massilia soli]MBZ2206696.1 CoA pyrophosphatase [Massilia soli]